MGSATTHTQTHEASVARDTVLYMVSLPCLHCYNNFNEGCLWTKEKVFVWFNGLYLYLFEAMWMNLMHLMSSFNSQWAFFFVVLVHQSHYVDKHAFPTLENISVHGMFKSLFSDSLDWFYFLCAKGMIVEWHIYSAFKKANKMSIQLVLSVWLPVTWTMGTTYPSCQCDREPACSSLWFSHH